MIRGAGGGGCVSVLNRSRILTRIVVIYIRLLTDFYSN